MSPRASSGPRSPALIGNGVVVDPDVLMGELDSLRARGVETGRLYVSERAHLIMPYHVVLDRLQELSRGSDALGTTGRGVGPAYMDKTAREGIRAGELLDPDSLLPRLKRVVESKNAVISKVHGENPVSLEEVYDKCVEWGRRLKCHLRPTELVIRDNLAKGEVVLLEGAQGTLLDLDHGTYPYVTSSCPSVGGACTGLGISPREIAGITGVFKAYSTRVGAGSAGVRNGRWYRRCPARKGLGIWRHHGQGPGESAGSMPWRRSTVHSSTASRPWC